ncbi:MAG: glycosyltransferase family 4 protein [Candidatus Omnitrophota bacterium]|nr:glycosyltransferase family 4 protein [Candidatus Omnitrophota bacterium]
MKVLHVNTHMNIGGIGRYILSLCNAMKKMGIDCSVASSGGNLEDELKENGIKHKYIGIKTKFEFGPKVFSAVSPLANIIMEEGVNLVHAHTRVSQVVSFLASRKAEAHYVSTCHGFFKPKLSRKLFDTWGERVVAISEPVKAHLERDFGINSERIGLIHNGVDMDKFSKNFSNDEISKLKRSITLKEGPVVGTIGRLSSVKGQKFLIEAMKNVISKNNLAQCLIIGEGPEEDELKKLAVDLGIENNVKFAGPIYKDANMYLACMDVFVLPSIKEGLGLALLEAMAAARPCVASDIGGIRDIVKDRDNGMLVPVADISAMADSISKLLSDKAAAMRLGQNGREFVKENFSITVMAEKMSRLYREVVSGKQ